MPWNLPEPPSGITGVTRDYLNTLRDAVNHMPVFSYASLATPESVWTGKTGDFFVNLGPASTLTRVFMKVGPSLPAASTTSWVAVRIVG